MTRDILLYNLCPVHRIYDCCNSDTNFDCKDCIRVMNEMLDKYDKQIRADAIDDFVKNVICELKSRHTDMPIVDILGTREKWKEKNLQYLECENLVYKIAKQLKEQNK